MLRIIRNFLLWKKSREIQNFREMVAFFFCCNDLANVNLKIGLLAVLVVIIHFKINPQICHITPSSGV